MILSDFMNDVAQQHGSDAMHGAMVFLRLKRPIDDLIANALAIGPYHPGKPSPWSHCFLITEPYHGTQTAILDCTIRDDQGNVAWEATLPETLKILGDALSSKGAGAIYTATTGDYDNPDRVTAYGVRWLPGLSLDERNKIVAIGRGYQSEQYAYDLPGLARELVRLLTGISIPPGSKRFFCSSFLQAAYRVALGGLGDFNAGLVDADTTPDDIWYAAKGLGIANINPQAGVHAEGSAPFFAKSSRRARAPSSAATIAASESETEIRRVLSKVEATPKLPNRDRVKGVLERALAQLDLAKKNSVSQSDVTPHSDQYDLSVVLSAIAAPKESTQLRSLYGRDIWDIQQYEQLDPRWIASLANELTHGALPFPVAPAIGDVVYPMASTASIAIAGDWGTGDASSLAIAAQMKALNADYTIHLGDVYYSGTEVEEQEKFVDVWPAGKVASLALNSNHEMYSGGRGYFGVALSNQKFRLQKGYSYFALANDGWLVIGLDSAHAATSGYQTGALNDAQIHWLQGLMASELGRSGGEPKNVILLTHHQGMEMDGSLVDPLWSQVTGVLGQNLHRWYWGHVHGVAAFKPIQIGGTEMHARLVGHGGIPYALDPMTPALAWTENATAGDAAIPKRGRNGFALLSLTDDGLQETLYDETGKVRWTLP